MASTAQNWRHETSTTLQTRTLPLIWFYQQNHQSQGHPHWWLVQWSIHDQYWNNQSIDWDVCVWVYGYVNVNDTDVSLLSTCNTILVLWHCTRGVLRPSWNSYECKWLILIIKLIWCLIIPCDYRKINLFFFRTELEWIRQNKYMARVFILLWKTSSEICEMWVLFKRGKQIDHLQWK